MADKKEITAYTIMNKLYELGYKSVLCCNDRHCFRKDPYKVIVIHEPVFLRDDTLPALDIFCGEQKLVSSYNESKNILFPKMPIEVLYKIIESDDDLLRAVREYFVDKDLEVLDD